MIFSFSGDHSPGLREVCVSEREWRLRLVPFVNASTRGGLDGLAGVILLPSQVSSGKGTSTFFDELPLVCPAELERAGIALGEDGLSSTEGDILQKMCA